MDEKTLGIGKVYYDDGDPEHPAMKEGRIWVEKDFVCVQKGNLPVQMIPKDRVIRIEIYEEAEEDGN